MTAVCEADKPMDHWTIRSVYSVHMCFCNPKQSQTSSSKSYSPARKARSGLKVWLSKTSAFSSRMLPQKIMVTSAPRQGDRVRVYCNNRWRSDKYNPAIITLIVSSHSQNFHTITSCRPLLNGSRTSSLRASRAPSSCRKSDQSPTSMFRHCQPSYSHRRVWHESTESSRSSSRKRSLTSHRTTLLVALIGSRRRWQEPRDFDSCRSSTTGQIRTSRLPMSSSASLVRTVCTRACSWYVAA